MIWVAGGVLVFYHLTLIVTHWKIGRKHDQNRAPYILFNWLAVMLAVYLTVEALQWTG